MADAIISRRGGGYAKINFDNYTFSNATIFKGSSLKAGRAGTPLSATTVGNYALFGGKSDVPTSPYVDAYDNNLTRSTPTSLSEARAGLAATTVGNYALFGGGNANSGRVSTVDAYDNNLTRSTPTSLKEIRSELAATTVGNYALFGGGHTNAGRVSTVDAYDNNLTRSTPSPLVNDKNDLAATTVGIYALFGGGNGSRTSTVDAYNGSLTKSTPSSLSQGRSELAATTVGDYALFGGGHLTMTNYYAIVDTYNSSLIRNTATALSTARARLAATTVGIYALFGGGFTAKSDGSASYSYSYYAIVDAYDNNLTRSTPTSLSEARASSVATTVGDYALFPAYDYVDSFFPGLEYNLFKGSSYKINSMSEEIKVTEDKKRIVLPNHTTGYIKVKNVTLS